MSYTSSWEIRWWYERPAGETESQQLATREWAHRWLLGFRGDVFRMAEFRRLLASAHYGSLDRCDDHEVLRLLGSEIESGRFLLVRRKAKLKTGGGAAEDTVSPPQPVRAPRPPAPRLPAPAPVADDPTLPDGADPVAIAAAMQEAAVLGVPFCEECARKALANARL